MAADDGKVLEKVSLIKEIQMCLKEKRLFCEYFGSPR